MSDHQLSKAWQQRFTGISRLYGAEAINCLAKAHMVVAGLGGVGTWAAEALARSGVGHLTLFDLDDVCITNTNRQIHALSNTYGHSKVQVLSERLRLINPEITITPIETFLSLTNIPELIQPEHDFVIDAIDMAHTKSGLIAYCLARKIRMVTVGSAGGKLDPSQVTWSDLAKTESDPLLAKIRYDLYRTYRFARDSNRRFRVDAIYSTEPIHFLHTDGSVSCKKPKIVSGQLDCSGGSMGSCTMVTGSFGFLAASRAIARYLARTLPER